MIFNRTFAKRGKLLHRFSAFLWFLAVWTVIFSPDFFVCADDKIGQNDKNDKAASPSPVFPAFSELHPELQPEHHPALHPETWKKDGLPFLYRLEKGAVLAIWEKLEADSAQNLSPPQSATGFVLFRRQSAFLRGERVKIEGRLLRSVFHPEARTQMAESLTAESPNAVETGSSGNAEKSDKDAQREGYYETWVLLDDEARIPARLLTRSIPSGFAVDLPPESTASPDSPAQEAHSGQSDSEKRRYRKERISSVGVYYRQTSYNAGDDFYNAPTVIAETFTVTQNAPNADAANADTPNANSPNAISQSGTPLWYYQAGGALLMILLWIFLRTIILRHRKSESASEKIIKNFVREPDDFQFPPPEKGVIEKSVTGKEMTEKSDSE